MDDSIVTGIATGIGAGVGALIANIAIAVNGWRQRVAEDRRHRREWAIKLALDEHERQLEIGKMHAAQGRRVYLHPVDVHILAAAALIDAIGDEEVNVETTPKIFRKMQAVSEEAVRLSAEYTGRRQQAREDQRG